MKMIDRQWKDGDHDVYYYYNTEDGRIVGQVHKIAHTKVWIGKIINNQNDEHYLGQYIGEFYSRKAVELYWEIEGRTLIE